MQNSFNSTEPTAVFGASPDWYPFRTLLLSLAIAHHVLIEAGAPHSRMTSSVVNCFIPERVLLSMPLAILRSQREVNRNTDKSQSIPSR